MQLQWSFEEIHLSTDVMVYSLNELLQSAGRI